MEFDDDVHRGGKGVVGHALDPDPLAVRVISKSMVQICQPG
jgi:hypothetical protein